MAGLPKGEETLPVAEDRKGRFYSLQLLKEKWPKVPTMLQAKRLLARKPSNKLLIERVRLRMKQGREGPVYRWQIKLTPEEQLKHMEAGDEIGKELIGAERKFLEWSLKKLEQE